MNTLNDLINLGKGVPLQLSQSSYTTAIPVTVIPDTESAAEEYEHQGGSLAVASHFGADPLQERQDLISLRNQHLIADVGNYDSIFSDAVSGQGHLLERAIVTCISLTQRLSQLL